MGNTKRAVVCATNAECKADELCTVVSDSIAPAGLKTCVQQRWGMCPGGSDAECLSDETCRKDTGNNVCVKTGCTTAASCPTPPAGTDATASCNSATKHCLLSCNIASTTCPKGMNCVFGQNHCQWKN
jgi:hypothetical protein